MKNIVSIILFVLSFLPITAMAGLYVAPSSLEQLSDGTPCNGCKLYFYQPGTTTAKTVYTDSGLTVAHSNPVTADSAGRFDPIYMDGTYKVVLKDADGNTIDTNDNYSTGASSDFFGATDIITATTAIDAAYEKHHIRASGTINLNLLAVATAGEGFTFSVRNHGTGLVTIDPNGSEEINDASTWIIPPASGGQIVASSAEWSFIDTPGITQSLTTGSMFFYSAGNSDTLTELEIGSNGDILMSSSSSIPIFTTTLPGNYTLSGNNSFTGKVITPDDGELTIATGAITPTGASHTVDTESDAATDDLDTISGGSDGQILTIRTENSARDVVITNAGNIVTPDGFNFKLLATNNTVTLQYDGTLAKWVVLGRGAQNVVVQRVYATVATSTSSGTIQIPLDDTIPQNTEGLEAITATITPTSATNRLRIRAIVNGASSGSNQTHIAALFQDSTANALQVATGFEAVGNNVISIPLQYEMVAGTTSATTFKVRMGSDGSTTYTLNGQSGARVFGGVMAHTMVIEEITP